MFEFRITMNENDYLLYNEYHFLNSSIGKKSLMTFRTIMPILCISISLLFILYHYDLLFILIDAIFMTISSILWIIFSKKILFSSIKRRIKKMKKDGKLPYSKEYILKFDDEIIHEITPDNESKTKYSSVEKIAVTDKYIYIYLNSMQAHMIPLTVFSGESEKLNFLEFLNSKIDNLNNKK